jgi:hypothetical protein
MMNIFRQLMLLLFLPALFSCKKSAETMEQSAIKVFKMNGSLQTVGMAESAAGNILAYANDRLSNLNDPQLYLLTSEGVVISQPKLTGSPYTYLSAVKGIGSGFLMCAAKNDASSLTVFRLDNSGNITWKKDIALSRALLLGPNVSVSADNNYVIVCQDSKPHLIKIDDNGNILSDNLLSSPKPLPPCNSQDSIYFHSQIIQPTASTSLILGYFSYDAKRTPFIIISNVYVMSYDQAGTVKNWNSTGYDTTMCEAPTGILMAANNKVLVFGSKTSEGYYDTKTVIQSVYGTPFLRIYDINGNLEKEILIPKVEGTPTWFQKVKPTPDGGYILIGSDNQLTSSTLVSNNHISLTKLNSDLSVSWQKAINTFYPSKGWDIICFPDGTYRVGGIQKENYEQNQLIFLNLDSKGDFR